MAGQGEEGDREKYKHMRTTASAHNEGSLVRKRKPALTFFHPDFTVGPGVSPDPGEKEQWLVASG